MPVSTSTIAGGLKETLEAIVTDDNAGYESKAVFTKVFKVGSMRDNYEDDLEYGGPGLVSQKIEGDEIATGTIREGKRFRYTAKTYGLKIIVTEEALEDAKYNQIIDAQRRLTRAIWKTADVDAANVFVRATDTNYVFGDGTVLAGSSHPLPHGGTFSNLMTTAMSPSHAAVIVATSQCRKLPGHDGVTEGYEPMKVHCPTEQWAVWEGLVGSKMAPRDGNFAEINVVNKMGLEVVPNQHWSNTTTNWAFITDCDNGLKWKWRRKPRQRSWVDNDGELEKFSISARWDRGISDKRAVLFSNA